MLPSARSEPSKSAVASYKKARAASVVARTDCTLWRLHGDLFRKRLQKSTSSELVPVLRKVEILSSLSYSELQQLIEALSQTSHADGETVIAIAMAIAIVTGIEIEIVLRTAIAGTIPATGIPVINIQISSQDLSTIPDTIRTLVRTEVVMRTSDDTKVAIGEITVHRRADLRTIPATRETIVVTALLLLEIGVRDHLLLKQIHTAIVKTDKPKRMGKLNLSCISSLIHLLATAILLILEMATRHTTTIRVTAHPIDITIRVGVATIVTTDAIAVSTMTETTIGVTVEMEIAGTIVQAVTITDGVMINADTTTVIETEATRGIAAIAVTTLETDDTVTIEETFVETVATGATMIARVTVAVAVRVN